jgi:hypothetical protein
MPVEIATGSIEPIIMRLTANGAPVLGATLRYDVTRLDGFVLDRADQTFRAVGSVGTRYQALPQVDAVAFPGLYRHSWDTSTIANPETVDLYEVTIYDTGTGRPLASDEIRVGTVDEIQTARRRLTQRASTSAAGVVSLFLDDGVTLETTYTLRDVNGDPVEIAPGDPARRSAET